MRLSRNRMWGHPDLIRFLEAFARRVPAEAGWKGLLVGDISQPRGGPMLTGHASHQIGLDADIWLTPMPQRRLSTSERENMSATNMVRSDWMDVDPAAWTPNHTRVIRMAARDESVHRIFVNPAIKKALCREAGSDRVDPAADVVVPEMEAAFRQGAAQDPRIAQARDDGGAGLARSERSSMPRHRRSSRTPCPGLH